ncbi:MAG: BrnA antitoxin family protein [Candidatus Thiothrix sulfatifontis]|uniref:BrnA antitoxin family protein n=1 Tax=Thiothrix subterranea TaxID=2735563 RepID=A0AA51MIS0_9GAMM|nr:BrnA antitoxin family protein [Thiothrix subterranea]MDQ5769401.1 BrnA antitoxin family protein [Thiothrix subterranea]UOG91546.1 MAG: BrnA antitoxin family protein [Candidatus Thiothrix sulfatifontis]WML84978.1 BrnA antitoxin family protein [Thiothrix subterranea]
MKAEYDLTDGKRGAVIPANGKTRITIWIDDDIIEAFRQRAEEEGIGYQTLVNQTLRASMTTGKALDEVVLRRIIREEMQAGNLQHAA